MPKAKAEKQKYSDRDNVKYLFQNWRAFDKGSFWLYLMRIPPLVVLPIVTALIPKLMIDAIEGGFGIGKLLILVGLMSFLIAAITWINPFLQSKCTAVAENMNTEYRIRAFRKMMNTDYEYIESLEGRLAFEKCKGFTQAWGNGARGFFDAGVELAVNLTGLFTYTVLLTSVSPILILIVLAAGAANFALESYYHKRSKKVYDEYKAQQMRTNYLFKTANDFAAGKDVRVFGVKRFFLKIVDDIGRGVNKTSKKLFGVQIGTHAAHAVLSLVCDLAAFVYLINGVLKNDISVSDFVFYFALVTGFFAWIFSLTSNIFKLKRISFNASRYREFVEREEVAPAALDAVSVPKKDEFPCEIEFENVTFSYRGSTEPTIKDMSFKIEAGEKIAVVGENGAGKTTCIKLLCGFYKPESGRILLNGTDISRFDKKEYYTLFAAVFQDYVLLPMSIGQNIALKENESEIDSERVAAVLDEAGLKDKIKTFEKGADTRLIKKVYEDAVNLSGGETQKLLLARALYKDAPILILDEPTAALDPIAENEMYLKYNDFSHDKTSFFISHRLSSTRFCDRIFFMRDGAIAEVGTHDELMEKKGHYYRMYEIQSYYYKLKAES
ncbi:MAG: ABC transporter ATP-binding protein/permease [Clostridiales bacterium]|jgi:ABC-type multidrug transport system fused ATPase/permease subunit|nr:ABC transporter ATP-binding protein/permease [Clostridiales bacterium]